MVRNTVCAPRTRRHHGIGHCLHLRLPQIIRGRIIPLDWTYLKVTCGTAVLDADRSDTLRQPRDTDDL